MRKVFQDFVFNFYKLNQKDYSVSAERLTWGAIGDENALKLLPNMYTDVSLSSPARKIILDTKYYAEAFQSNWGKQSFHSSHMYQLNSYLDAAQRTSNEDRRLDGVLLYPATNDEFTFKFGLRDHSITVASIDMRKDSSRISSRLLELLD